MQAAPGAAITRVSPPRTSRDATTICSNPVGALTRPYRVSAAPLERTRQPRRCSVRDRTTAAASSGEGPGGRGCASADRTGGPLFNYKKQNNNDSYTVN